MRWTAFHLAAGLTLAACTVTEYVETEVYACTSHAQCGEGFRCSALNRCEPGPKPLDAAMSPDADRRPDADAPDAVIVYPEAGVDQALLDGAAPADQGPAPDLDPPPADMAGPSDLSVPPDQGPPRCGAVDGQCCADNQQVAAGTPCRTFRLTNELEGIVTGNLCLPRKIVEILDGTCDVDGACAPTPGAPLVERYFEWCSARHVSDELSADSQGCVPLAANLICPYARADFCSANEDGTPCNVPSGGDVGPDPPVGLCVNLQCVPRDAIALNTTVAGPLTWVPDRDPAPGDFQVRANAPVPMFRDTRTWLWWQRANDATLTAETVADAAALCAALPPVREGHEQWRLPDLFEVTALLADAAQADAMAGLLQVQGNPLPWWTASMTRADDGAIRVPAVDFANQAVVMASGAERGQVRCVFGPRRMRPADVRNRIMNSGSLDRDLMTNIPWTRDPEPLTAAQAADPSCGGLRGFGMPRPPRIAEAASLLALRATPEYALNPAAPDDTCIWSSPAVGGRWRVRPSADGAPLMDVVPEGSEVTCLGLCLASEFR